MPTVIDHIIMCPSDAQSVEYQSLSMNQCFVFHYTNISHTDSTITKNVLNVRLNKKKKYYFIIIIVIIIIVVVVAKN